MELSVIMLTIAVSFILAVILGPLCIPLLRRLRFGQQIRDDGPQGHKKKTGTPIMGGIIILMATTVAFIKFADKTTDFYVLLISCLGFGLIGFLDDYIKIAYKRSLGLTARQKLFGQLFFAIIICVILGVSGHDTGLAIPGTHRVLELGWLYYPLVIVMMLGTSNATNITDGLDGLLSGTSAIAFGAFVIIAMKHTELEAAFFSAGIIGALLGFLVFNAHPAKIFMGDTGSLALGGGMAAVAIITKTELLLVLIGLVFVIEILSVIIQVISFKTTGKRVFKMSPIHHHFELSGWSEWRVVITFWSVGLLCACLALFLSEGL